MVVNAHSKQNPSTESPNYKNLKHVITILEEFKTNRNRRLNFSKLGEYLRLKASEVEEILKLVLSFQELFETVFNVCSLKKKIVNNQIYLRTEQFERCVIPQKIRMTKNNLDLLNDIIYCFKFVKKGGGFDVKNNGSELLQNVKNLYEYHPYLFQQKIGLLYPSELGLKLGELILSFKKNSKHLKKLEIDGHIIFME